MKRKPKASVVGNIQDRIQNAIKQSQNERYNRDALDELGKMDFKVAQSKVQENNAIKPVHEEDPDNLVRENRQYLMARNTDSHKAGDNYKVNFSGYQKKPSRVITDEERFAVDYMITDKNEKQQSGWNMKKYMDNESIPLDEFRDTPARPKINRRMKSVEVPIEQRSLAGASSHGESKLTSRKASFADALAGVNLESVRLPDKALDMNIKLEVPDYDTSNRLRKIQQKKLKENMEKRIYEDDDEFKDLREEKQLNNMPSYEEGRRLRENFILSTTVK